MAMRIGAFAVNLTVFLLTELRVEEPVRSIELYGAGDIEFTGPVDRSRGWCVFFCFISFSCSRGSGNNVLK